MTNKPEKTFRAGACSASVFINDRQVGEERLRLPSVAFSCRYRDESTGEWKDATSMSPNEVARAVLVLQKALEHCLVRVSLPDEPATDDATRQE